DDNHHDLVKDHRLNDLEQAVQGLQARVEERAHVEDRQLRDLDQAVHGLREKVEELVGHTGHAEEHRLHDLEQTVQGLRATVGVLQAAEHTSHVEERQLHDLEQVILDLRGDLRMLRIGGNRLADLVMSVARMTDIVRTNVDLLIARMSDLARSATQRHCLVMLRLLTVLAP
ncbi:hypothetical protein OG21DRAFT_204568, partial [Imleria badia]